MNIAILDVLLDLGAGIRGTDMGPRAIHVAGLVPALERLGHLVTHIERYGVPDGRVLAQQVRWQSGAHQAVWFSWWAEKLCCTHDANRIGPARNIPYGRAPKQRQLS